MLNRKEWFATRFFPLFKQAHPEIHMTFDVFANKSREIGFDHRTQNKKLREQAKILYQCEVDARKGTFADDKKVMEAFLDFIETEGAIKPHKTSKTRKLSPLDLFEIQKALPNFSELDFKLWSAKSTGDKEHIEKLKTEFRSAYEVFDNSGDARKLEEWDKAAKALYKKKK